MTNKEAVEVIKSMGFICDAMTQGNRRRSIYEALNVAIKALEEPERGRFECRIEIKDLISMLLEYDMNEKATIYTPDEHNIVISITDMRGEEE